MKQLMMMQITLYFFAEKKLIIKFIIISRQRYFKMNNKIRKSLILSRNVLFFLQKSQLRIYFSTMFFK